VGRKSGGVSAAVRGEKEKREERDGIATHLRRNCSESKWLGRVMASGSPATASTMELSTGATTAGVSESGSAS